jgi:hypothetical protein
MACNGNATESCGGSWRLNLYQASGATKASGATTFNVTETGSVSKTNGSFTAYSVPTTQKEGLPQQWKYVGCLQ